MRAALALAGRGLGRVWPNPSVGCVLVRDRRVVGRGWTQPGGRPHAETEAIARAGPEARGATAYVTLEPCAHHGRTPPCADALVAAGIGRAVVAVEDPDPRVAGAGIARLRAAGVAVDVGLAAAEAADLNAGFLSRIERRRPLVALKVATTLDGRIATAAGESQWITSAAARRRAHLLRARYDAVAVGAQTAILDNPELTCRLPGLEAASPVRVVFDSHLRTPFTHRLVAGARTVPTWFVTLAEGDRGRMTALRDLGVEVLGVGMDAGGNPDVAEAMAALAARGLTRVLVEGGAHLGAALLRARLVDTVHWFRAPAVLGGEGIPVLRGLGVQRLADMPRLAPVETLALADDVLETYRVQA